MANDEPTEAPSPVWEYECRGCNNIYHHGGGNAVCRCGIQSWIRRYTDEYRAYLEERDKEESI